tara:strand:- start:146 stop:829 length:684 start_codon:yes stop_codon:yes gene_type:complete
VIRITENYLNLQDSLAESAENAGRDPKTVRLLAVSKKKSIDEILETTLLGQRDFGENVVQESIKKIQSCDRKDLIWHFIGYLQSNKTRAVAEHFQWVHTIDRLKIATRLSKQRPDHFPALNVCIEVNIDGEEQKAGVLPDDVAELARAISTLPRLKLRGLMCLPAIRKSFEGQKKCFSKLRKIKDELNADGLKLDTLSMGMSADYPAAIHEGTTIVRIGTALFGERV